MDDVTLTDRICELLGTVPGWTWDPDIDKYPAGATAIFYGAIDLEPDQAIGVRVYSGTDDLVTGLGERRAQVRFRGRRGDPTGADKLASVAFAVLQGLSRVGGISGVSRLSMAPLGADVNGRLERTDNYIITLDNLEATT